MHNETTKCIKTEILLLFLLNVILKQQFFSKDSVLFLKDFSYEILFLKIA